MKTIQVNLYEFSELTQEAKDKAREGWNKNNDFPMLTEDLEEWIRGTLPEYGIEGEVSAVRYSLGYSQGDGAMFEGSFTYKGVSITAKHSGHYYHENSKNLDFDYEGLSDSDPLKTDGKEQEAFENDFNELYIGLCRKLAKVGYEQMEYEESETTFAGTCEANEYTFEADGTMNNG